MRRTINTIGICGILLLAAGSASAQCPQLYDYYGMPSSSPYWYSCTGNDFSFNLQSPDNWSDYTVDWGDGSPASSGTSWNSPSIINHIYTAAVDTFVVTITENATGCVVQGVVVMEESTSASIQIPVGGLTQACAPQVMEFINSSTNVSETTIFTWDFGDGSPNLVFDHTNWGQTISHLYDVGTVDCETVVTLTAENYCNTVQGGPSEATFNPIRIWDLDDPGITASATLLCYPDTVVTFMNTTERNCLFQGNIYQRYEYWNFGDHWNLGYDSIVDWTPWPPTFPHTIAFPGIGSYTISLLDSNYCGIAPASITIQIVPPPIAGIDASADTVCVGEPITFYQLGSGNANSWQWNLGNGMGWIPTGPGNITYVFDTPGTYTVQNGVAITGSSSACDDFASMTVVVLPGPSVDIFADPLEACDQADVTYSAVTSGAVDWQWDFDSGATNYSGEQPPPVSYGSPGEYQATLTVTSANGCTASDNESIHIYASPEALFNVLNLCEGDTATFVDASVADPGDPIISWLWDFGDGASSNEQIPQHFYNLPGSYNVTLTVATANCSDQYSTSVQVEAAPVPVITPAYASGCSPVTVQFQNNSQNASSYLWSFGDGEFTSDVNPVHTFTNNTLQDIEYSVSLTAYNNFGCARTDSALVTVHAHAIASFLDNNDVPGCSPYSAEFTNTSQNAVAYIWDFGDGATSTSTNPVHLYLNETGLVQVFTVTLIAIHQNGCNDTVTNPIIVYPIPDFDFDLSMAEGCAPLNVTMPFIFGAQVYNWNFGDGSTSTLPVPTHQFDNPGIDPVSYTVTLEATSAFGCSATTSSTVTVYPNPTAQFVVSALSGCSPLTIGLQNLSSGASSYEWNYGDGTTSQESAALHDHVFVNNTGIAQTYTVTLTAINDDGCEDTFQQQVVVYPASQALFFPPAPQCSPATIQFVQNSQNAVAWSWDFGNGFQSVEENPQQLYLNATGDPVSYTVVLNVVSADGCTSSATQTVVINPTPVADFTLSESVACQPAPLTIFNNSQLATNFTWNYGDGTSSTTSESEHTHVFNNNSFSQADFTITLVATTEEGCSATAVENFSLYPQVIAAFVTDTAECAPFVGTFVNQSQGADFYQWTFGDGGVSNETNPDHLYSTSNTADALYNAQLIATNVYGCTDTATVNIHVYHSPVAVLQIDSLFGCYPQNVVFYNGSIGADSFQWVYGTGETSTTNDPYHTVEFFNYGDAPVFYDVVLHAYTVNGCHSSDQLQVEVSPELEADFYVDAEGCTPLTVYFDNNSDGALSYLWDFGDGDISNDSDPVHTYFNYGTADSLFVVTLTVFNAFGCSDSTTSYVQVSPIPVAQFTADPIVMNWPESTVQIDNTSFGGAPNFIWDLGDGTAYYGAEPGSHTYSTWGTYTIELQANNGMCSDTAYQNITILAPPPVADFMGPAEGCAPLTVYFTNNSEYAVSSSWQFGDGGAANATNPVYTYWQPGTYTVTLTVTGYDGSSDVMVQEQIIHVYPSAIAAFTVTPNEVAVPSQPVYCLNLSQNATYFEWLFGDGSTSNQENPIYYYEEEGVYDVTLIANNQWNCPDTMTVVSAVYATEGGAINFPNAFTPNTTGGNGGGYDPMSYDNDIFFPEHQGISEYRLQIFNKWGELLFETADVYKGWDGYYRGLLCKQDVYVWKAKGRFVNGQSFELAGDVTLLVR